MALWLLGGLDNGEGLTLGSHVGVGSGVAILALPACREQVLEGEIVVVAGQSVEGYGPFTPRGSTGYGFKGEEVHAPGPTIRVEAGEAITITFENEHYIDGEPFRELHDFAVVALRDEPMPEPLWGSATDRIKPGDSDSVTFTPDVPGTYYYVCRQRSPTSRDGGRVRRRRAVGRDAYRCGVHAGGGESERPDGT